MGGGNAPSRSSSKCVGSPSPARLQTAAQGGSPEFKRDLEVTLVCVLCGLMECVQTAVLDEQLKNEFEGKQPLDQ